MGQYHYVVMTDLIAFPPLPVDARRDFAFKVADPEGMRSRSGIRFHGAVDWFSDGGTEIASPAAGRIIHAHRGTKFTGQVFGGHLTIEQDDGLCWQMRHVEPVLFSQTDVEAGEIVAKVSPWKSGPPHMHLEIWKSLEGGYWIENCIDPADVMWAKELKPAAEPVAHYYFEEMPAARGGLGPDPVGQYSRLVYARNAQRIRKARGELVSIIDAEDGFYYLLRWLPGTHGRRFRFGPWTAVGDRNHWLDQREANTGRTMRPFNRRALSFFPYPRGS